MSFSKARLQRFNEIESEVPPPGAYDPKFDSKIKGLVIEKSERFQDSKSVASAECVLSTSCRSTGIPPVTAFRTPQLPRKRVIVKPKNVGSTKTVSRSLIAAKDPKMKYDSSHELADLQVECTNKDKTIQENEKHIEEMKEEIRKLELQIEDLHKMSADVEEQHKRDIETMAKLQQEVLNDHDEKHQAETQMLKFQLLEVSAEKEQEIVTRKATETELRNRVAELLNKIHVLESEVEFKKKTDEDKGQELRNEIEELTAKLQQLEEDHNLEVSLLEEEKSKLNLYINNLSHDYKSLEDRLEKRQNVILELQAQLSTLQCELDELKAEYEKLIVDSDKQVFDITNKLEAESKAKKIDDTNTFLTQELQDVQRLYKDLTQRLWNAHQELEDANAKHAIIMKKHKEDLDELKKLHSMEKSNLEQQLEEAREDYSKGLENLVIARDKELIELKEMSEKKIEEETRRIQQHADKLVENAEAVTRETLAACRAESEERVKRVIAESDAKVNAMIREARTAVEEEMRLTAERYKTCLARVEVERAALDEKLAQRDAEISRLSTTLEELKSCAETQESFSQSLQIELDKAETDLAEKKEELRALKDQIRAEAAEMVARRKRFEVIMAENQASVAALTKRLAQSNAEVERLQHELKRGEDCIYEHRDLLSIMRNNSQMVHEQVHALMEQLDAKKGLVDQLEADSLTEFESIKSVFEAKIDHLRQIAAEEITRLQEDCDKKTVQNTEMKNQLREMAERLAEAQDMLLKMEEDNDKQATEISQIELLNTKLQEQLRIEKKGREENKKLLETQSLEHKIAISKTEEQITELTGKVKSFEGSEKHFEEKSILLEQERIQWKKLEKALMEQLEQEKALRETAEVEVRNLQAHNERLINEYQEISEKYAEVIGHQNHKQRIKHVSQLKDKIAQLEQDLLSKNRTIELQQKTIEKFKLEEKRAHGKGKENIGIQKSAHTTPVSSPHKPLTPLRNRNE
ncbi:hypothetical protein KM043_005345 [Ampulex compressa]|nr:hypothetical protein KM043_005345 [Ampulex compressa]